MSSKFLHLKFSLFPVCIGEKYVHVVQFSFWNKGKQITLSLLSKDISNLWEKATNFEPMKKSNEYRTRRPIIPSLILLAECACSKLKACIAYTIAVLALFWTCALENGYFSPNAHDQNSKHAQYLHWLCSGLQNAHLQTLKAAHQAHSFCSEQALLARGEYILSAHAQNRTNATNLHVLISDHGHLARGALFFRTCSVLKIRA